MASHGVFAWLDNKGHVGDDGHAKNSGQVKNGG